MTAKQINCKNSLSTSSTLTYLTQGLPEKLMTTRLINKLRRWTELTCPICVRYIKIVTYPWNSGRWPVRSAQTIGGSTQISAEEEPSGMYQPNFNFVRFLTFHNCFDYFSANRRYERFHHFPPKTWKKIFSISRILFLDFRFSMNS